MEINEILAEATRIRKAAQESPYWNLNIDALIESNNECFEGPISREDMEACFNFVLDKYDPNVLIKEGFMTPEDYSFYIENYSDGNPFFSLIELDDERNVKDVVLGETDDCEWVGEFLSKKYKWKDS